MATLPFLATIALSLLLCQNCISRCENAGSRRTQETLFLGSLLACSLFRPEGALLSVLLFSSYAVFLVEDAGADGRKRLAAFLLRGLLIFVIPGTIYFLWRLDYYGHLFPNAYYVKSGLPDNALFNPKVAGDLAIFFVKYLFIPLVVGLLLSFVGLRSIWRNLRKHPGSYIKRQSSFTLLPAVLFVGILDARYLSMKLQMNFCHRFFTPTFLIGIILMAVLIDAGIQGCLKHSQVSSKRRKTVISLLGCAAVLQVFMYVKLINIQFTFTTAYKLLMEHEHLKVARILSEALPPDQWLIAYQDAGAIPYFSGLRTVDFGRLNDERLTHGKMSKAQIVNYFYSFDAAALVFTSFDWEQLRIGRIDPRGEMQQIIQDPRFKRYVLVGKFRCPDMSRYSQYYTFLFARKDLKPLFTRVMSKEDLEGGGKADSKG
jgi:hypothetical protein